MPTFFIFIRIRSFSFALLLPSPCACALLRRSLPGGSGCTVRGFIFALGRRLLAVVFEKVVGSVHRKPGHEFQTPVQLLPESNDGPIGVRGVSPWERLNHLWQPTAALAVTLASQLRPLEVEVV